MPTLHFPVFPIVGAQLAAPQTRLNVSYEKFKVRSVPIRIVSRDNSFSREYRDIKEGAVPDAVFELPPGFIKMNVP